MPLLALVLRAIPVLLLGALHVLVSGCGLAYGWLCWRVVGPIEIFSAAFFLACFALGAKLCCMQAREVFDGVRTHRFLRQVSDVFD